MRGTFAGAEESTAEVLGARIRYLVGGYGPPLVFVHGIAASSFSFRLVFPELSGHFRLYLPDFLPDCSRSQNVETSLRANAERLLAFLQQVGIDRPDLIASSHGGAVTMELAALAPERVRKMVLVSPANPFARRYERVVSFYLSTLGRLFMDIAPFLPGRAWDYGIGRMYADPASMTPGTGIGYARALRGRGATRYIRACLETFSQDVESLRDKLPAIARTSTMLIWGDRDSVVEVESGHQLARALNAKLAVMRGVGQLPYEERPEEFNQLVLGFLG